MTDTETDLRETIAKLHQEIETLTFMPQAVGKRMELRHQIAEATQQIHALRRIAAQQRREE